MTLVAAEFSFPSNDFNQTATTIHTKEFVRYQRQCHGGYSTTFHGKEAKRHPASQASKPFRPTSSADFPSATPFYVPVVSAAAALIVF
jgi:hypothetical protein